ncbi:protein of unknown function [Microbacterium sp. RURRCA19A]|nr:protein of unknown function [Microbacterium sp. RURRCA19A]
MVRALRLPADQDEPITALEVHQLEDYQAAVGGWIEPVDIPELGITIYVHEEGLVLGLPFNSRATFLWWYFIPEARHKAMLVGPALIVGLPDRNGDSTSIPNDVARLLTEPGRWRVEAKVKGEKDWMQIPATHTDYFEALVWAMVTLERWRHAEDVRVVPVGSGITIQPIRATDAVDLEHPPAT